MLFRRKVLRLCFVAGVVQVGGLGCSSLTGPSSPTVNVSLEVQRPSASDAMLHVRVGGRDVVLRAAIPFSRTDATLEVDQVGAVPVALTLLNGGGTDTLATIAYSQTLTKGYVHGIGAIVSRLRPAGACVGTVLGTPLRGASGDTLFVMYVSQKPLPKGSIC